MALYNPADECSAPIMLDDRNILQQHSAGEIEIVGVDPETAPTPLKLPAYVATIQFRGGRTNRVDTASGVAHPTLNRGRR